MSQPPGPPAWAVLTLVGPVAIAALRKAFRNTWFWIAIVFSALLHGAFLRGIRRSLPFTGLGVAIIFGTVECFVLLLVSAKLLDAYGQLS
jgi:hypothetical protein